MAKTLLIVGAGFAGLWSALAAARRRSLEGLEGEALEIVVLAPEPELTVRPRLYEPHPERMTAPLGALFAATGVRFVSGMVETLRPDTDELEAVDPKSGRFRLQYDRLVLASGSRLHRPPIPGLGDFTFSIDQRDEAVALDRHLRSLAHRPASARRDTVVVVGGGFTGLELAAELPARLRAVLGEAAAVRVVVLEQGDAIGPGLGAAPRPVIARALADLGVEHRVGCAVAAVDSTGVVLADGARLESETVIWTAGLRPSPLTAQLGGPFDPLGRVRTNRDLRSALAPKVFLAGDVVVAATQEGGPDTLMSCQHAMMLGRTAGDNAVADLLGRPLRPYSQPAYVTCLDLGPWGAVLTQGWERQVQVTGPEAKAIKRKINEELIYPPADRDRAFELANPAATSP